jgi:hypothetical protein
MILYISIGNSDDELTQAKWSEFVSDVGWALGDGRAVTGKMVTATHGVWFSAPDSRFQNACWCVELEYDALNSLRDYLAGCAREFRQESIAMARVSETEFIEQRLFDATGVMRPAQEGQE